MTDEKQKSENDKPEISEEEPIVTSHRLELADAALNYMANLC